MITAIVLINVDRGKVNETATALLQIEEVSEVWSVSGDYDLVAIVRVKEYELIATAVTNKMLAITTIAHTHTLMGFKCYSREDLSQAWDMGLD